MRPDNVLDVPPEMLPRPSGDTCLSCVDPIDLDPTKIRIPTHRRRTFVDGTASSEIDSKIVPAKMVERSCPHCDGTGIVKVKVPCDKL